MKFKKIREEFSEGVSLLELSKKYSVSYSALLRRSKRENWRRFDQFEGLRQGVESLSRLIAMISISAEQTGKMEPRDIKYLTSAEKELLELIKETTPIKAEKQPEEEKLKEIGSPVSGVIFIPEV